MQVTQTLLPLSIYSVSNCRTRCNELAQESLKCRVQSALCIVPWLVVRGSLLVARGPRFVARGPRFVVRGSWFVARGPWLVARGPWLGKCRVPKS